MRWARSASSLAILGLSCCGCSMPSVPAIAPAKIGVSADHYGGMSCAELRTESERILGEAGRPEVSPSQESPADIRRLWSAMHDHPLLLTRCAIKARRNI